jgi:hypothetical protein
MKADTNLKKIVLNIKDRDLMVAEKYNERLEAFTSNALWTMANTALGAGLGQMPIDPLKKLIAGVADKVEGTAVALTRYFTQAAKSSDKYTPKVGAEMAKGLDELWEKCFLSKNPTLAVICTLGAGTLITKALEAGVNASAELTTKPQSLMEMDEKDIAKATNMIASAKTNIRISADEFEKLAYVPPRQGESPRKGWFSWLSKSESKQDIGIIPRLGDKLSNGFLCPNERVAAKIALFRPLEESQYKQIRDEIRAKLPNKVVPSTPVDSASGSADTSSDGVTP